MTWARMAASIFDIEGALMSVEPYGTGHINATFVAVFNQSGAHRHFLIQRINTDIFKDPEGLMENVVRVTEHLHHRLEAEGARDISRRALTVVRTRDGAPLWRDPDGGAWRCYLFIKGVRSSDLIDSYATAEALGRAVGNFQCQLADLPGPRLVETIPGFHDARRRYAALERAIAEDRVGRAASVAQEINFVHSNREGFDRILTALESGVVPERITHNDTKISNLLVDEATGEAICIIDLDTVMPGSTAYDFGDLARTVPASIAEDDPDFSHMHLELPMYQALVRGYACGASPGGTAFLTSAEIELLPWGARIITLLMVTRFLTDYLEGDHYYRIARESHNLDRCRTQIALIRSMDSHWTEMTEMTEAAFAAPEKGLSGQP